MDLRAAKIILALFLLISFITPLFRLSVSIPGKGKATSPLAMTDTNARQDSTSSTPAVSLLEKVK